MLSSERELPELTALAAKASPGREVQQLPIGRDMSLTGNKLVLNKTAVLAVASTFTTVQSNLGQLDFPLGLSGERITVGAGDCKAQVEDAVLAFLLSWDQVFKVCAESATVIANGCSNFTADAFAVDEQAEYSIL